LDMADREHKNENFWKIKFEFFSNSAFSRNFHDLLYKCYHSSVIVKYILQIPTVLNFWDVKLEVRVPFLKIIHEWALSELFENLKLILHENFLTVQDKNKWIKG
jgi:hypothetical protein